MVNTDPIELILKAVNFSANKHRHQRRKDKDATPYINHPLALALLLKEEAAIDDLVVLCSAILHDTLEDTDTTAVACITPLQAVSKKIEILLIPYNIVVLKL